MRRSGILMPVSCIPSEYGIGAFSKEAYEFVDFLEHAGQKMWQILPLGPTGYGDSPYQSFSTFAGNPYFIDLEKLTEEGLLKKEECTKADFGRNAEYVNYEKMYHARFRLLRKAFGRSHMNESEEYCSFIQRNAFWLEDYALYMAIKDSLKGASFLTWEEDIKLRRPQAMEHYREKLAADVDFYKFLQYQFEKQWTALKTYANRKGIQIIGDIPIYVALDGADTWARPELFLLDENCVPLAVAGCPPDAFSSTGQLWGNPLYRWDYHRQTGYEWWMNRIEYCYQLYDIVRIDHFRGFESYYSIPYGDATAEFGHWEKGPDYDIFRTMKEKLGDRAVIAEDLGYLTPAVLEMVERTGYPGMKVLQFAFDPREESDYLPHNYIRNCIVYTGTHDNQTTAGWVGEIGRPAQEFACRYLNVKRNRDIPAAMIRAALSSVADTAVIPIQDWLMLGKEARINMPSTLGGNWEWRLGKGQLTEELAQNICDLTRLYCR